MDTYKRDAYERRDKNGKGFYHENDSIWWKYQWTMITTFQQCLSMHCIAYKNELINELFCDFILKPDPKLVFLICASWSIKVATFLAQVNQQLFLRYRNS
jgi:hypothetical protein